MEIEGVKFKGTSFDDFRLVEPSSYSANKLERFTFNKGKIEKPEEYVYVLCNCIITFETLVKVIVKLDEKTTKEILTVTLKLGKPATNGGIDYENATFQISIGKEKFSSEGDVFEIGLEKIQQQFKNKYHFKNCFGCLYSDYSPYGNGFFGDMLCFKKNKQEYSYAYCKI